MGLYGFGSSAHLLIQIVRHRGAEVYVVARDEKHREMARQMARPGRVLASKICR